MNSKGRVIVFFVCFLKLCTSTDTCDKILEGSSIELELTGGTLRDDDRFTIKKDKIILVPKRTRKQKGPGVVKGNLLVIQNVKPDDSGTYEVETFDKGGKVIKSGQKSYCVYAKVSKPIVNFTCDEEKIHVHLECKVAGDGDLSFIWRRNEEKLKETTNFLKKVKPDYSYTCTASNGVDNNISDPVTASCPKLLMGFAFWPMVGILAGGGTLVLILIFVMVTICCYSCKRKKKHQSDEEEYRLNYLNISQPPQKSKQTARGQPAPPEPVDNNSSQYVDKALCLTAPPIRNQQRARPPPPPVDEDEEQAPPLPRPRKKKTQSKKHEGPL